MAPVQCLDGGEFVVDSDKHELSSWAEGVGCAVTSPLTEISQFGSMLLSSSENHDLTRSSGSSSELVKSELVSDVSQSARVWPSVSDSSRAAMYRFEVTPSDSVSDILVLVSLSVSVSDVLNSD